MNTISKSQLRSDMDWRRRRVDKLEYNTKKAIASLQQPDALNLSQLSFYHKYLAWCVQILDQLKRDTASVYEDYDYIELLIDAYKHELTNINNQEVITYYIKPITLLKQPTTGYDTFLQTGVTIYLKYIDIYQMWFTRNEVNALLINTEPDMSSYAFLALLACFTGLNNGMLTKQVYKINFKKAKECLAEAYANSSFKNI
ncbi:hypothetical protein K502DRAFT_341801 [Neoconidiobolus thromboides FSU 785]|nr:hypothetical protein K502DRAFT_341801 [Neoconidiobolus thromboides FSU 785]